MSAKKIVLRFPPQIVDKPWLYHLVKDYDLMVNVLYCRRTERRK